MARAGRGSQVRARKALLKKLRKNRCSVDGCKAKAVTKVDCLTCEQLVAQGKHQEVHVVYGCFAHREEAEQLAKSHALKGHPVNILRATVAALKGEEVF